MARLLRRRLGSGDEAALRAFWATCPQAHIFATPDLDHFGWIEPMLDYTGWYEGDALVGAAMFYGSSAQWEYRDSRVLPMLAREIEARRLRFLSGLEAQVQPVLALLPQRAVSTVEQSYVMRLAPGQLQGETLARAPGRARRATLRDLDALAALHVAAPDQFNHFDLPTRRRMLRGTLTDGWRRLYLAEAPDGAVVASGQSSAEGREIAVVGGVVTHPEWRGMGYATMVTAHLSQALLRGGMTLYLYVRRDNQHAIHAYRRIGYEIVGDALLVKLDL